MACSCRTWSGRPVCPTPAPDAPRLAGPAPDGSHGSEHATRPGHLFEGKLELVTIGTAPRPASTTNPRSRRDLLELPRRSSVSSMIEWGNVASASSPSSRCQIPDKAAHAPIQPDKSAGSGAGVITHGLDVSPQAPVSARRVARRRSSACASPRSPRTVCRVRSPGFTTASHPNAP